MYFAGSCAMPRPNADAYAGLGEADFAKGNYRAAQRDFQSRAAAGAGRPSHPAAPRPMRRTARAGSHPARPRPGGAFPPEPQAGRAYDWTRPASVSAKTRRRNCRTLIDKAGTALKARVSAARQSEVSESNLDLAEQLWQAREERMQVAARLRTVRWHWFWRGWLSRTNTPSSSRPLTILSFPFAARRQPSFPSDAANPAITQ